MTQQSKPFGGSADDLRREQQMLNAQLTRAQQQLAASKRLVDKVEQARSEGDNFLNKYFTDSQTTAALILTELNTTAHDAGIKMGQAQFNLGRVIGPVLAGVAIALGTYTAAFVINTISFGAMIGALVMLRLPHQPSDDTTSLVSRVTALLTDSGRFGLASRCVGKSAAVNS